MKCLRCGYCCIHYGVIIVKPECVDNPQLDDINSSKKTLMHKEGGKECPHLSWEGDTAICGIHDKDWYEKTPCFSHGQIEQSKDDPCRLGQYMIDNSEQIRR